MDQEQTIEQQQSGVVPDVSAPLPQRIVALAMDSSISQLVNAIAHQINNSLTPILGYSQLLREIGMPGPDNDLYLQRISEEAENLTQLVQNLLVFTRRRNAGPEMVHINTLLKESVVLQTYEIVKRDVDVRYELAPDLPHTVMNAFRTQVAVLNIVQNAFQSIAERGSEGTITIRTSKMPCPVDGTDTLSIEFVDDGPGMAPEVLQRAFEPFFTTKVGPAGPATGLGLTVCRQVIEEQGGRVSLQSVAGEGTTVCLELPVRRAPLIPPD